MSVGLVGICNALARAVDHAKAEVALLHGSCESPLEWPGLRKELSLGLSLKQQALAALNPLNIIRIMRFIRQHRIDRAYIFSSHPIDLLLVALAPILCIRVCLHLHDPVPHSSQRGAAAVLLFNKLVTRIPWLRIAASSEQMADLIVKAGLRPVREHVRVVPLPVHVERRTSLKARSERHLILMIGRLEAYKGPDLFVEIARRSQRSALGVDFMIAGPDERGLMPALARDCLEAGVQLDVRRLSEAQFADYVSRAVAVCMPYRDATDSAVAPIAFEFGTPVIGFAVGGLTATIKPNVNGLLCAPGNLDQFVNAIQRVASDPALFDHLSKGAQQSARQHSPPNVLRAVRQAVQA